MRQCGSTSTIAQIVGAAEASWAAWLHLVSLLLLYWHSGLTKAPVGRAAL